MICSLGWRLWGKRVHRFDCCRDKLSRNQENMARLSWLDILRGIGIIYVVIGHIYSNHMIYNWIYSFHMPLFFIAAGYTYKEKPVLEDIKRRIQTIIIPYFSFGLLILIYWQLIERRFRDSDMGFLDSLIGLFLGEYRYLDFNVHLWFLPCFFMTVVLFNIFVRIPVKISGLRENGRKLAYLISAVISFVFIITNVVDSSIPDLPFGIDRVFKYFGFYAAGCILHEYEVDVILRGKHKGILITIAMILLAVNFGFAYIGLDTGIMWFVTAFSGVASVGIIAITIERNHVIQYLGGISLIILCVHGPVYRVVIKLMSILLGISTDALRENFLLVMTAVGLVLLICSTIYEFIVRIAPWMIGRKKVKAIR